MNDASPATTRGRRRALKKPPLLFARTQALIRRLQEKVQGTFMAYWNSPSGNICGNDVVGLYGVLRAVGEAKRITLFIKSDGGSGEASLRMVNLLRQFTRRLVALVPLECQSAATMLALGADEIHMGPLAHLSAVDTSLTHDLSPIDRDNHRVSVSQDELHRVIALWQQEVGDNATNPYQALFQHVHPLVIGAVHRASSLSTKLCIEILSYHLKDRRKAKAISDGLNAGYPSHSYPITLREARRIGLNAQPLDGGINELLFELNALYSEMGQRALTDFDEHNYHDNSILNIIEGRGVQIYYQSDKDWHYRKEERRWVSLNDKSSWRKVVVRRGRTVSSIFHIG
ncbi:MAG: hypothetical protein HYS13_02430 [Planctomycetia bacterium]|nr:hypothetical protein [Planctomycetia bacterium]